MADFHFWPNFFNILVFLIVWYNFWTDLLIFAFFKADIRYFSWFSSKNDEFQIDVLVSGCAKIRKISILRFCVENYQKVQENKLEPSETWFEIGKVSKTRFFWYPISHFFAILVKIWDFHIYVEMWLIFRVCRGVSTHRKYENRSKMVSNITKLP